MTLAACSGAGTAPERAASPEPSAAPSTATARVWPGWEPADPDHVLTVASTDFEAGGAFPASIELDGYGCDGENARPELHWSDLPEGTESVVVTFTAEGGGPIDRWVLVDVPPDVTALPGGTDDPTVGVLGQNSLGRTSMIGPCAKSGESWELWFTVYALDTEIGLEAPVRTADLLPAGAGHVLAAGELAGTHSAP